MLVRAGVMMLEFKTSDIKEAAVGHLVAVALSSCLNCSCQMFVVSVTFSLRILFSVFVSASIHQAANLDSFEYKLIGS